MELVDEACYWYSKRYRIETFSWARWPYLRTGSLSFTAQIVVI
jgi:hypothetical protein